jgi:hypothetical protein
VTSLNGLEYRRHVPRSNWTGGVRVGRGDPMFVNSATHPNGTQAGPALSQLGGFQLRTGSLAIDKGVSITGNGGVDFWGGPLYVRTADIGPYEAP